MLIPIISSVAIVILIILIPILGNIKTPENLHDWYTGNSFKVALIGGFIAIVIIWISYLLLYV